MEASFPRSARLLKSEEFTAVFRSHEFNLSDQGIRVRAIASNYPQARLGLVVSKRGNPKACRRNRLKRIIRESFRKHSHEIQQLDIVVQIFRPISDEKLKICLLNCF
ncbi:MAG: ribonuclease P protein component, partial [Pseudomonadales bacterium]|nr:ribonuclease P protein component [Pseudomonadales bacterium]